MDIGKEINYNTLWGDNVLYKNHKPKTSIVMLNSYFKAKFKIIGEELIKKANEIGIDPNIEIKITYKDLEK